MLTGSFTQNVDISGHIYHKSYHRAKIKEVRKDVILLSVRTSIPSYIYLDF